MVLIKDLAAKLYPAALQYAIDHFLSEIPSAESHVKGDGLVDIAQDAALSAHDLANVFFEISEGWKPLDWTGNHNAGPFIAEVETEGADTEQGY